MRVLVAEASEDTASKVDSVLRDAGVATRIQHTDDVLEINEAISTNAADLAYVATSLPDFPELMPKLREANPHMPIIAISLEHPQWTSAEAMTMGASDLVCLMDHEHLTHVSMREIEHVCQRVRNLVLTRALREAEERCVLLLQGAKDPIAYIHEGMHIYANEAYVKRFGYTDGDDLLGASFIDLLSAESGSAFKEHLKVMRAAEEDAETRFAFTGTSQEGNDISGTIVLANATYEGEACLQVSVLTPQEALEGNTREAQEASDDGSLDLGAFLQLCEGVHDRDATSFVFLFAMDGLEEVRSKHGLLGVEQATEPLHAMIHQQLEGTPIMKLAPGEYVAALFNMSMDDAHARAQNVLDAASQLSIEVEARTVHATLTAAGARIVGDVEHALDAAYQLLQEQVSEGAHNRVILEPEETQEAPELDEAGRILATINEAIEHQSFKLLFQPIISLRGDADEHYEVFLRMLDSDAVEYAPNNFLQTAIEHQVAAKIDRWVILQSIKALCVHRSKGHNTRLTINVTSNSVADPEFIKWLSVAIKAARLPSDAVIFQITEQDANTYVRQTREFVEGLREMHCQSAIGRFGLLEEPFELLQQIPVDMVKIDGSHVASLQSDNDTISPLLSGLQELGKFTIVPMVESASQLSGLWQAGANYVQGHYLQEPTDEMAYDFSIDDD